MSWFERLFYRPNVQLFEQQMEELTEKLQSTKKELDIINLEYQQYLKNEVKHPDWKRNSLLSALFYRGISKKEQVYKVVRNYRENYLYTGIMQLLVEDALSHDSITNEIVQITSDNPELNKELEILQKRVNVDALISSTVEDLLSYGEYFLSVDAREGEGVIEVKDDANQSLLLAVYDGILPKYFLRREQKVVGSNNLLKEVHPSKYLHFCYGYSKIRIEIDGLQQREYLRMGKPLMWGTFNLLNYLDTLTALVPALYVQKLNSTSIVGVSVPEGMDPKDALEAAQRYESILNRFTIGEENEQVTAQILSAAGKFKCVPVWTDKGQLQDMDPRWKENLDPQLFEELRRSIMASVGIPYNFLFGGGGDKQETLKQFSRYVRKLGLIQKAVRQGLVQLALIHLVAMGKEPNVEEIQVKFTNTLIDTESLDKIEFIDTLLSVLKNATDSLTQMSTSLGMQLNAKVMQDFLASNLRIVNLENLFEAGGPTLTPPTPDPANQTLEDMKKVTQQLKSLLEKHSGGGK